MQNLLLAFTTYFIAAVTGVYAQSGCPNVDFSQGTFANWQAYTGEYSNCCNVAGLVPGRHTMMSGNGIDSVIYNCNGVSIPTVMPGKQYSVRLGNSSAGAEADQIRYVIPVTAATNVFTVNYALVMQYAGHLPIFNEKFTIKVKTLGGYQLNGPGHDFTVLSSDTGLLACTNKRYRNWSSHIISLVGLEGTTVVIEITSYDCSYGGHYGYSYLNASCGNDAIFSEFCQGDSAITLKAPGTYNSYSWSTGDTGKIVTLNNPVDGFSYTVTGASGSSSTTWHDTLKLRALNAGFNYTVPNCNTVSFIDTSSGDGYNSQLWNFGDGTTSVASNPTHTYATSGQYNVTLTTGSSYGCSSSITVPVQINHIAPQVILFSDSNSSCSGDTVRFTTNVTPGSSAIASWLWEFGDSTFSVTPDSVNHVYTVPSTQNLAVKINITDSAGCSASWTKPAFQVIQPAPPVITGVSSSCNPTVSLIASSNGLSNYQFLFGDGSPWSSTSMHTYQPATLPALYQVVLKASDNYGCISTDTHQVTILNLPSGDFSFTPPSVCWGDSVIVTDSLLPGSSPVTTVTYSFLPGLNAFNTPVYYTPTVVGQNNVSMTMTDTNGCTITQTKSLNALGPQFSISSDTTFSCSGDTIWFTSAITNSGPGITSWFWDFGDGGTSTSTDSAWHIFNVSSIQSYDIKLTLTDSGGCVTNSTFHNYIFVPQPYPFTISAVSQSCSPTIQFTGTGATGAVFHYDFGDGSTGSNSYGSHTYQPTTLPASYLVTLTGTNFFNCSLTDTHLVTILDIPSGNFSVTPNTICLGDSILLQDTIYTTSTPVASVNYSVLPGVNAIGGPVYYTPNASGSQNVAMTLTDTNGCTLTINKTATVNAPPIAGILEDTLYAPADTLHDASLAGSNPLNQWQWTNNGFPVSYLPYYGDSFTAGTYNITLLVTDTAGCADSIIKAITVAPLPQLLFTVSDSGTTVWVDGYAARNTTYTFDWDFGDGGTASGQQAQHTYATYGTYQICMTATENTGYKDTICQQILLDNTGISEQTNTKVSIFPNPSAGSVTFKSTFELKTILLYDQSGKLVLSKNISGLEGKLDLNSCADGIYLLNFIGVDGERGKELIHIIK